MTRMTRTSTVDRVDCRLCDGQASFITPVGAVCLDHAIEALEVESDDAWLPIPIRGFRERAPRPPFTIRHLEGLQDRPDKNRQKAES